MSERQWYGENLCPHYDRNCRIIAPCCNKMFGCRLCHDEKVTSHKINRHAIKRMQCNICFKFQRVRIQFPCSILLYYLRIHPVL